MKASGQNATLTTPVNIPHKKKKREKKEPQQLTELNLHNMNLDCVLTSFIRQLSCLTILQVLQLTNNEVRTCSLME
jgi:hypothetical protein